MFDLHFSKSVPISSIILSHFMTTSSVLNSTLKVISFPFGIINSMIETDLTILEKSAHVTFVKFLISENCSHKMCGTLPYRSQDV